MTPRQRMLIQSTYEMAMPRLNMVSNRFYARLLKAQPELNKLFKGDLQKQGQLFSFFITHVIQNLGQSEDVEKMLSELGVRHKQYGVHRVHYELASKILISSVRLASGINHSYEIHKAWEAFYAYLVLHMDSGQSAEIPAERLGILHQ